MKIEEAKEQLIEARKDYKNSLKNSNDTVLIHRLKHKVDYLKYCSDEFNKGDGIYFRAKSLEDYLKIRFNQSAQIPVIINNKISRLYSEDWGHNSVFYGITNKEDFNDAIELMEKEVLKFEKMVIRFDFRKETKQKEKKWNTHGNIMVYTNSNVGAGEMIVMDKEADYETTTGWEAAFWIEGWLTS